MEAILVIIIFLAIFIILMMLASSIDETKQELNDLKYTECKPHKWEEFNYVLKCEKCGFVFKSDI